MATCWTRDEQRSVVIVEGSTRAGDFKFGGNGFIAQVDTESTWIVTCAHVVDNLGDGPLRVDGRDAQLVSAINPGIDLAVLRVSARLAGEPLALIGLHAGRGWIAGWEPVEKDWRASTLDIEVGRKDCIKRDPATEQYAWALEVKGFADSAEGGFRLGQPRLIKGFSGAPVVCPVHRAVFAVARQMSSDGEAGYGICIEHLRDLWPVGAPQPIWLDQRQHPLDAEDQQRLAAILQHLPAELTLADLRGHVQRCSPVGTALDVPGRDDPRSFLSWLIVKGQQNNGRLPLFDVLARLRPALKDELQQRQVQTMCDALAAWYPDLAVDQPDPADPPSKTIALRVELIDPGGEQRGPKRYDLAVHQVFEGTDPQRIVAREGNPGQRFCPTDDEETGFFVTDLLFEWLPDDVSPPERLTLSFRLPHTLLGLPVDAWRRDPDDPDDERLGGLFPVLVQEADRHRGKVAMAFWKRSWDALSAQMHEPLSATLCFCTLDRLRTCGRKAVEQGCGIGVSAPLCLTDAATKRAVDSLLRTLGATVLIWPRDVQTAERLRDALADAFAGKPLRALPVALRELRAGCAEDPSHPELEITLLWDPPPDAARRPSQHGISE
jgi:hypothetical protein